jgi:hypothetical protein
MAWKKIRLELARTPDFPGGSVGRAFLLSLPLQDDGSVDWDEVSAQPSRATVQRFWASEPDRRGRLSRSDDGWLLKENADGRAPTFRMPPQQLTAGQQIAVIGADGRSLPFQVVSIKTA